MNDASGQLLIFLQFIQCGILLGLLHFATHPLPFKRKFTKILADAVYVPFFAAVVIFADYAIGNGEMKLFYAAGIILGVYLYYKTLKFPLDKLAAFIYNKLK